MRDLRTQSALAFGLTAQQGISVTELTPLLTQPDSGYAVGGRESRYWVHNNGSPSLETMGANFNLGFCDLYINAMKMSMNEDSLRFGISARLVKETSVIGGLEYCSVEFDVVDILSDLEVAMDVAKTRGVDHFFNLETQEVVPLSES